MLRIDVDHGNPFAIPADNPFANTPGAVPSIWAYGLRNPFRFAFDRATGDLYIGDVGQSRVEEIDVGLVSRRGGENYGWNVTEGVAVLSARQRLQPGRHHPARDRVRPRRRLLRHGRRRLPRLPDAGLRGHLLLQRLLRCLRPLLPPGQRTGHRRPRLDGAARAAGLNSPTSFGTDVAGEVYIVDQDGEVYKIVPCELTGVRRPRRPSVTAPSYDPRMPILRPPLDPRPRRHLPEPRLVRRLSPTRCSRPSASCRPVSSASRSSSWRANGSRAWTRRARPSRSSWAPIPTALAFVTNATGGVNTVLRSLTFSPGDEILVIDQGYNACQNAARFAAERSGARVVVAHVPFPLARPERDHGRHPRGGDRRRPVSPSSTTSRAPPASCFPSRPSCGASTRRASTPSSTARTRRACCPSPSTRWVPPTTPGNCHKWMCTPKGSALLYVRKDRQAPRPSSRDQPRRQRAAHGPQPLPPRVRLHGNPGPHRLARDPRGHPLHGLAPARGLGRAAGAGTTPSPCARARSCARRSASRRPRPRA